jgi:hypothetical protein
MTNTNSAISTIPPAFSAEGYHRARAIGFVEVGTIFIVSHWQHRVRISFELPYDMRQFDENDATEIRPKIISKEYASRLYGKSKLKLHLQQWLGNDVINEIITRQQQGKPFDPYIFIGQICQIKIEHIKNDKGNWFEEITDVQPIKKQETIDNFPDQISQGYVLTYEDWLPSIYNSLSDYVKDRIASSKEYKRMFGSDHYDDIPLQSDGAPDQPLY